MTHLRHTAVWLLVLLPGFLLILLPAAPVRGATIEVTVNADPATGPANGDGCTLREAISNANDNAPTWSDCPAGEVGLDNITFATGVVKITLTSDAATGEIVISDDLQLDGPVIIDGADLTRLFVIDGGAAVTMDLLTLQNGYTAGDGGAIRLQNGELNLTNALVRVNNADGSGGAFSFSGQTNNLTILNTIFQDNHAGTNGGAIYKTASGELSILTSVFQANMAGGSGGAIYADGKGDISGTAFNASEAQGSSDTQGGGAIFFTGQADFNILSSAFSGNLATGTNGRGGAIYNSEGAALAIQYSHFGTTPVPLPPPFDTLTQPNETTGSGGVGGAIYNRDTLNLLGVSMIGNRSAKDGGALASDALAGDNVRVTNSTLSDNQATGSGGAIYQFGASGRQITLTNVTVSANIAASGGGIFNATDASAVQLSNTIIHENLADNCAGATVKNKAGNLLTGDACPADSAITTGDADLLPVELLVTIPNVITYFNPLGSASAASGTGDPLTCALPPVLLLDQRLAVRPQGMPQCDSGAYESDIVPDVSVSYGEAVDVIDGGSVNLGTTAQGSPLTTTFTVTNAGTQMLSITTPTVPSGFSLTPPVELLLDAAASTTFGVTCDAASTGTFSGSVSFNTNDPDETLFNFTVSCTVNPPGTEAPTSEPTENPTATYTPGGPTITPTNTIVATATGTPVITGEERLVNGDFEATDPNTLNPDLTPWVLDNPTKDKIKCDTVDKIVAHAGNCAFLFKGSDGEASKLKQTVTGTFAAGDVLTLSLYLDGRSAATVGKAKLIVKYDDETSGKVVLTLTPTEGYTLLADSYALAGANVSKVKVLVQNKSLSGKFYLDDVSVKQAAQAVIPLP